MPNTPLPNSRHFPFEKDFITVPSTPPGQQEMMSAQQLRLINSAVQRQKRVTAILTLGGYVFLPLDDM